MPQDAQCHCLPMCSVLCVSKVEDTLLELLAFTARSVHKDGEQVNKFRGQLITLAM